MRHGIPNSLLLDRLFLHVIALYQRRISPRKGWRCAYSTLHGGTGCSGAVQSAIRSHGWRRARVLSRQRFRDCKLAAQVLQAQAGPGEAAKPRSKRRKAKDWSCEDCDTGGCMYLDRIFDCGPGDSGCCDCTPGS